MTEQLKTMLDRAAAQHFDQVDVDAITAAGDRTVRRRRIVTGAAGVAALVVLGVGAAVIADGGDDRADFTDDPFRTDVPMWTEGSVLHTPDATYDLGVDVFTFVRTSEGIVFTGQISEERLGVYSFTGEGDPDKIGETEDPHLRSDPDGPYAGWLDQSGDRPEAVVIDQGSGDRVWSAPAKLSFSFPIVAIDGSSVYLADADEHPTHLVDLVTGEDVVLGDDGLGFVDVEGDLSAYLLEDADGAELGLEIRSDDRGVVEIRFGVDGLGVLSPGGRWISVGADDVSVYDTATGASVDLGATDAIPGMGIAWADRDTMLVVAQTAEALVLMSCEVPSGECEELTTFDDFSTLFAVPDSDLLWMLRGESGGLTVESSEVSASEAG